MRPRIIQPAPRQLELEKGVYHCCSPRVVISSGSSPVGERARSWCVNWFQEDHRASPEFAESFAPAVICPASAAHQAAPGGHATARGRPHCLLTLDFSPGGSGAT